MLVNIHGFCAIITLAPTFRPYQLLRVILISNANLTLAFYYSARNFASSYYSTVHTLQKQR